MRVAYASRPLVGGLKSARRAGTEAADWSPRAGTQATDVAGGRPRPLRQPLALGGHRMPLSPLAQVRQSAASDDCLVTRLHRTWHQPLPAVTSSVHARPGGAAGTGSARARPGWREPAS